MEAIVNTSARVEDQHTTYMKIKVRDDEDSEPGEGTDLDEAWPSHHKY
jgi:hypothetical protein